MTRNHHPILILLILAAAACLVMPKAWAGPPPRQGLPPSTRMLLKKVRDAMDEKDYSKAITLIRADSKKGKTAAPCSHPLVCLALGNSHLMRQDYGRAEAAYTAAIRMDPEFLDARVNLAKVYTDTNCHPKAAAAFAEAYDLSRPKAPEYLYYSGVMTLMDGRAKEAAGLFETLFAAHPEKVRRLWRETYANALMTARLWKKAVPVVRELADGALGDERIRWQETLLQIFLTMDDLNRAKAYAISLSRESPGVARWWKALVHIHLSLGNYDRALDSLIICGFAAPLSGEEKKLLADLSLQLDLPSRAAALYEEVLGQPPDPKKNGELIQRLVNALRQTGRTDQALALLNRLDPGACDAELLLLKGNLFYEVKDFQAADKAYRLAAQGDCARKGQAWLMAGYAAWQNNNLAASRTAFERAARYKPHRRDALAAIAQLERTSPM